MTAAALAGAVSTRPILEADYPAILNWFAEPDFYYRSPVPDTRAEWEVRELVGTDSQLLSMDGAPIGLFAFESVGPEHSNHYQLHLRLRHDIGTQVWADTAAELISGFRWRQELIRLVYLVYEFDERGAELAGLLQLTDEGTLADIFAHRGRRAGYRFFSRIWTPDS